MKLGGEAAKEASASGPAAAFANVGATIVKQNRGEKEKKDKVERVGQTISATEVREMAASLKGMESRMAAFETQMSEMHELLKAVAHSSTKGGHSPGLVRVASGSAPSMVSSGPGGDADTSSMSRPDSRARHRNASRGERRPGARGRGDDEFFMIDAAAAEPLRERPASRQAEHTDARGNGASHNGRSGGGANGGHGGSRAESRSDGHSLRPESRNSRREGRGGGSASRGQSPVAPASRGQSPVLPADSTSTNNSMRGGGAHGARSVNRSGGAGTPPTPTSDSSDALAHMQA